MKPLLAALAGIAFGYLALKGASRGPVEIVTPAAAAPAPVAAGPLVLQGHGVMIEDDVIRVFARDPEDGTGTVRTVRIDRTSLAVTARTEPASSPADGCLRGQSCEDLKPILKRLAIKPDPAAHLAIANGRLLRLAPSPNGALRLAARDVATKAKLYDEEVPGLGYGTVVGELYADRDDVFLVANGALLVLDARTGRLTGRFDSF